VQKWQITAVYQYKCKGSNTTEVQQQICIKYSLDGRRPITTAAAFDAADWLPNRYQHKWLQVAMCF